MLISRVFAECFPQLTVLTCCLSQPLDHAKLDGARTGLRPFATTMRDVAAGVALAATVPLESLPNNEEIFFLNGVPPGAHGKYSASKAARLLGWEPQDDVSPLYTTAARL